MILQALVKYYETLAQQGKIAKPGWSYAKLSYALDLGEDGSLKNVISLKQGIQKGKKIEMAAVSKIVPESPKRAGKSIKPQFAWDNSSYLLGIDGKGKPERSIQCFEAAKQLHLQILSNVNSPCAMAVKNFFRNWSIKNIDAISQLQVYLNDILKGGNLVLTFNSRIVSEYPEIVLAWDEYKESSTIGDRQQCLITGKEGLVAILHPNIKGVRGAQSSGASIVSFNKTSFESYGKDGGQGRNAPVSQYATFAYTTALNRLLADPIKQHKAYFGDTTVVYWSEDGADACRDLMGMMLDMDDNVITNSDLHDIMSRLSQGQSIDFDNINIKPDNKFYILGLAPNAARIAIRFFYVDTFGSIVKHFQEHYERLQIVKPKDYKWKDIPLWVVMQETVNKHSRDKASSPLLAGALFRSIITGTKYPMSLYQNIILRVKADSDIDKDGKRLNNKISVVKAAIIKACLQNIYGNKEETTVALNEESKSVPYVLGRMFAVLEDLQQAANPGLNSTIKDRYFNSACATPNVTFPILMKLAQHHLKKLTSKPGWKVSFEKKIGQLENKIEMGVQPIPAHLSLENQGKFILGYYHQKEARYEKKEEKENE